MSEAENNTPRSTLNNSASPNSNEILDQLKKKNQIAPGLFILTLILFALPFFKMNCGGQTIASISGYNLVFGTEIEEPGISFDSRSKKTKEVGPVIYAIVALLSIVAGLYFSLNQNKESTLYTAVSGAVGTVFIFILNIAVDNSVQKETDGGISVETTFAYWLVLLSLAAITALSYVNWKDFTAQELNQ